MEPLRALIMEAYRRVGNTGAPSWCAPPRRTSPWRPRGSRGTRFAIRVSIFAGPAPGVAGGRLANDSCSARIRAVHAFHSSLTGRSMLDQVPDKGLRFGQDLAGDRTRAAPEGRGQW